MYFNADKMVKKGEVIVNELLEGGITDFREFVYCTTNKSQTILTRSKNVGKCVSKYVINSIEDDEIKNIIIDKIFSTKNYDFILVFRVAKDIATKFDKYEDNKVRKISYLKQHKEITESIFDFAYHLAKYSSLAKKSHLIDETISYAEIQSEFISA